MEEQELMCAAERLQRAWEETARNIRDKFRLCLHEGGHALFMRRYGDVNYHGPYVNKDGRPALGAVSPKGDGEPGPIEKAASHIAGPLLVHLITGTPDNHVKWEEGHDVQDLQKQLDITGPLFELAKQMGEAAILTDVQQPDFLSRLGAEVCAYEYEIFGTTETWYWAWKEYCLDWFRERIPVADTAHALGYLFWLIPDGAVKLFLHGRERQPSEKIYGVPLEVYPLNPGERAAELVRRWNELVVETTLTEE